MGVSTLSQLHLSEIMQSLISDLREATVASRMLFCEFSKMVNDVENTLRKSGKKTRNSCSSVSPPFHWRDSTDWGYSSGLSSINKQMRQGAGI